MKTIEIIGYKRANLGKTEAKQLRLKSYVPSVLYGGEKQVHFYSPMILFRDIVYTPEIAFISLNIEGEEYKAILQDVQFHPVSEIIMHADFLELRENKPIKMKVPIKFVGNPPGVKKGGKLITKLTHLNVKALPKNMPQTIEVDVNGLELGKNIKVGEIKIGDFEILNSNSVSVVGMEVPRAMKGKTADEEKAAATEEATQEEQESSSDQ